MNYTTRGLAMCLCLMAGARQTQAADARHLWTPVADGVYLQEVGMKAPSDRPVTSLGLHKGVLYAVVDGKMYTLEGSELRAATNALRGVARLFSLNGDLWATTEGGAYRLTDSGWQKASDLPIVDFCIHDGTVNAATQDDIYRLDNGEFVNIKPEGGYLSSDSTVVMDDFSQVLMHPVRIGPIMRIESYSGTLYILRPGGLALLDGARFVPEPVDWGEMPRGAVRDFLTQGSRTYVATSAGVAVLRGMALTTLTGDDGLPYEDTTCLAQGFDGDLWIGTTTGAIRKVGSQYHYFGAEHWLPGDIVHDIAAGDRVVYIATDKGVGIIQYEPYTLLKKAVYFERELEDWGFKRLGFVHKLYWDGEEWVREVSDNDGGHTAHYLAAMSYKYAATGDPKAREAAVDAFTSMAWLQQITGTDGFFARAIFSAKGDKGKMAEGGSGGLPAKWYPTNDGLWYWKGDTSSDEVDGHFYSVSLFHDLAAQGAEKDRAKEHLARITSHIIDNGWVLRDMDGKPTRWGRWDPDYLLRPYGMDARGLNGMQAQSYVWTAYKLTGDEKYKRGLDQLLEWRYHTYTVRQKLTFPPDLVVPWDDELAFRTYNSLLRYSDDPYLRSVYLRSLERSWEVMRMQKLPFFNFTYGAYTGNDCEAEEAVQHLREWSLDLVSHRYRNSHRADLKPEPGYVPYSGGTKAISPRELDAAWGSRPAIRYDGGSGGRSVTPPIGWLEDYWMGRYYGFIQAPDTDDPGLLNPSPRTKGISGAKPYAGAERPKGIIPGQ